MHQLDRTLAAPPECLRDYDYRSQGWDDLSSECKQQLRNALGQMQSNSCNVRCAYCEGAIYDKKQGHIEHFCRKHPGHYPELTFAWENLFLSCSAANHCGHYKDGKHAPPYNQDSVIKPDKDDPDKYLYFHSSGEVRARSGLNPDDAFRANETIRVFGLDNQALSGKRRKALSYYRQKILDDLDELATWSGVERHDYFYAEIEATHHQPYATTIRHFLQSRA